ncbi:DUF1428 domain-containing protein [Sphingomonas corticis]|uniref:DUF1428 domain-containing protein n=1 Tax=Sphingomonas corticis TaxID=2722791 RepID=A0ABX1CIW6_9SPHN|nr:DUF1428 domain-containing protein [Sphingomonas corticis]
MTYVEGFVTAVPTQNRDRYVAHAREAAALVKEFGAARFVETWGDDVPRGTVNDLWSAVQAKDGETVLFSWFEYPDKAARDAANAQMMADPRMEAMGADMPFDGSRMIYAGFDVINEAGPGGDFGYLDGVVVPAATDAKAAYLAFSRSSAEAFVEHGATRVVDAWGDDVPDGKVTDYKRATHLKEGESVAFGWIEWPSKAVRDAAWEKLMADDRLAGSPDERGMDGKRMMFGGFTPLLLL